MNLKSTLQATEFTENTEKSISSSTNGLSSNKPITASFEVWTGANQILIATGGFYSVISVFSVA